MDLGLKGKRAIVTGGSRGIGKVIARHLLREGVDVVIAARNKEPLEAAAKELARETGGKVVAIVADTASESSVNALVAGAVEALGGLDILINNAALPGGSSSAKRFEEIADELRPGAWRSTARRCRSAAAARARFTTRRRA